MSKKERHHNWYDAWKALSFARSFLQARCNGDPDTLEIDKLLQVAQYMCRLNSIAIQGERADMSLVDPEMACNPEKIQYVMENYDELVNEVDEEQVTEVEVH